MARDYTKHDGQVINAFTVMTEFQRATNGTISSVFETFKSTTDFNADGPPFGQAIRFADMQGFAGSNTALIQAIISILETEMGLAGRGYTITEFQWVPVQKVLTSSATKAGDARLMTKKAADHDTFIAAHVEFDQLNAAVWTYGKANNAFLNAMTPAP